jgi:hypothetical protein
MFAQIKMVAITAKVMTNILLNIFDSFSLSSNGRNYGQKFAVALLIEQTELGRWGWAKPLPQISL